MLTAVLKARSVAFPVDITTFFQDLKNGVWVVQGLKPLLASQKYVSSSLEALNQVPKGSKKRVASRSRKGKGGIEAFHLDSSSARGFRLKVSFTQLD